MSARGRRLHIRLATEILPVVVYVPEVHSKWYDEVGILPFFPLFLFSLHLLVLVCLLGTEIRAGTASRFHLTGP